MKSPNYRFLFSESKTVLKHLFIVYN